MASQKLKLGVLISGRGSNLQSLIDACVQPDFPAEIVLVISNKAEAGGLARAEAANIETAVIDHKAYETRAAFDAEVGARLNAAQVDLVCLAGFMRIFDDYFAQQWSGRLINIHPSLLPAFRGLHVHEQAIEAGVKVSGCTVHYVVPELDAGPIIAQAVVPVAPEDTADTLASRVLSTEHRIYPLAVRLIAEGKVRLEGNRAVFTNTPAAAGSLINPPTN